MKPFVIAILLAACVTEHPGAQTAALDRVMRQKLADAQAVMAAVVTNNWAELNRRSRALAKATDDPAWLVLKTPEYAKQSAAFIRAIDDLVDAAERRDQDAAPLAYMAVTVRCVQCHRYVARARIAGAAK